MTITIREERPGDEAAIHEVNRAAFGQDEEPEIVDALREAGAVALSLVAVDGESIVGHICFSPVRLEGAAEDPGALCLAPMAVLPDRQRQGIGSALIRDALDRLRSTGHAAVVLVGHAEYYPRFGFVRASGFGLRFPPEIPVPDEAFMAIELTPGTLAEVGGTTVRLHPAFGIG